MNSRLTFLAVAAATALLSVPVRAADGVCFYWAQIAESHYGMPRGLMTAIVRHESFGRPNTLNVDGKALHFASPTEAARAIQKLATTSFEIDVGCSQLTIRWHGKSFKDIGSLLDPRANISYAAWHLAALKDRFGSWQKATERYHSFQNERGRTYACKVMQVMKENKADFAELSGACNS